MRWGAVRVGGGWRAASIFPSVLSSFEQSWSVADENIAVHVLSIFGLASK